MHTHGVNVQRGAANHGVPAMTCNACHQARNNDRAHIPGAPDWHLAPGSMGWVGLSTGDLCRTILDKSKNGNREVADLKIHMTTDPLVLWAWEPGEGRTPPPVSAADLKIALDLWVAAGTPCPN